MDTIKKNKSIAISIIITIGFWIYSESSFSIAVQLYTILSLFFASLPLSYFFMTKEKKHILFFPVIFITWVYFMFPFLKPNRISYPGRTVPEELLPEIALYTSLSIIMLFIGYYYSKRNNNTTMLSSNEIKVSTKILSISLISLILLDLSLKHLLAILPIAVILGPIIQIMQYSPTLILAIGTLYITRKGKNIFTIGIIITYAFLQTFYFIGETLFSKLIVLYAGAFLIYIIEKRRFPYIALISFVIIFAPILNSRFEYRNEAVKRWFDKDKQLGYFEIVNKGVTIFQDESIFSATEKNTVSLSEDTKSRFELVSFIAHCANEHKNKGKTFKMGSTFWWLPLTPIPRAILPFKPQNLMATKVAEDYGLKVKGFNYAINFPILVEFYINFGYMGMIILSFFQGIFIRKILQYLNFGDGDLNVIVLLTIIYPLIVIEGNITLMYGMILSFIVFWTLFFHLFIKAHLNKNTLSHSKKDD